MAATTEKIRKMLSFHNKNRVVFTLGLDAWNGVGPVSHLESTSKAETKQRKSGHGALALLQTRKTSVVNMYPAGVP